MSSQTFRSRLFKIITHGITACGGATVTYYFIKQSNDDESTISISETTRSGKWDHNWDKLDPASLVKPLKSTGDPKEENEYNEKLEKRKSKATRHIILIRHGQYHLFGKTDAERILTPLGRHQAELAGQRLAALNLPYDSLIHSTMARAIETATIIHKSIPNVPISSCALLEEGAPYPPEPPLSHWKPERHFFSDGARIEAAFRKYFHRALPSQKEDSYEIIVCHANVIRYFVCRIPEKRLIISRIRSKSWTLFSKSEKHFYDCQSFRNHSLDSFQTWDSNWDKLPCKSHNGHKKFVLVRTGHAECRSKSEGTVLSKLGERQAKATGERLKQLYPKFESVVCAPSFCCQNTAQIIVSVFKEKQPKIDFSRNSSLIEIPLPSDPPIPKKITDEIMMFRGLPVIESAFRNVCYRPVKDERVSYLIVAESNFIRYFICRALQFPIDHWVRFTLKHCSISEVAVQADGKTRLRCAGEAAHLQNDLRSC